MPAVFDFMITPFLVLLIMLVLSLLVIGPLLHALENVLLVVVEAALGLPLGLGGLVVGFFWSIITLTGVHHIFNMLEISLLASTGFNPFNAILCMCGFSSAGVCLAISLKAKKKEIRAIGPSATASALLGIGERTGNCPLEAMAIEYAQLRGTQDGMDFTAITDIAEFFEKDIGYAVPPRTPFVGRSFNSTRAGIHADGLLKDEEIYNIFDTGKILNRPATVAVDSHSGLAGIAHWINGYFNLKGEHALSKRHELVMAVRERVDAEYARGRNTVMGDEELEQMVFDADPGFFDELMAHKRVL